MNSLRERFTEYLMRVKAKAVARRLVHAMNFPIQAASITKVLVILPRNLELLDRASNFVQSLRKTYPDWRVELFDVDKLSKSDLNSMNLPRPEILNKLRRAEYHFVVDLNDDSDDLSGYISLMTEAPYRLQLGAGSSVYSNIVYQPQEDVNKIYYDSLLGYLRKLFVRN